MEIWALPHVGLTFSVVSDTYMTFRRRVFGLRGREEGDFLWTNVTRLHSEKEIFQLARIHLLSYSHNREELLGGD